MKSSTGFISRRPGLISKLAFPAFILILTGVSGIVWFIHYPRIQNVRGAFKAKDSSGNTLTVEMDPRNIVYKIEPGQAVQLTVDEYPYAQYGTLFGVVGDVRNEEGKGIVAVSIRLRDGFNTDRHREIVYRGGLGADILLMEDGRLLQRVFAGRRRNIQ